MKKALLMLAIVTIASFVHAAQITWKFSSIPATSGTGTIADGSAALLFVDQDRDAILSALKGENPTMTKEQAIAAASFSTTTSGGGISTKVGNYSAGTTVSAFTVVFDSPTASAGSQYMATASVSKKFPATGSDASFSFGTPASQGYTWTPIPEPTTIALLALGLAAIGLKRKVA